MLNDLRFMNFSSMKRREPGRGIGHGLFGMAFRGVVYYFTFDVLSVIAFRLFINAYLFLYGSMRKVYFITCLYSYHCASVLFSQVFSYVGAVV